MEFTPGERETLAAVIQEHIATGEAVGSQAVAGRLGKSVCSATVRNRMSGLERKGLLGQPHTSAGRVPTDAGYRYYVDHLMPWQQPDPQLVRQVSAMLGPQQDIEPALQLACRLLAELTRQASLASPPDWQAERLHYAEITPLSRHQVLLLVLASSGRVSHSVATVDQVPDRAACRTFSLRLNERYRGELLSGISAEGLMTLARGLPAGPQFCRQAAEQLRSPEHLGRPFLLEGASNLLGYLRFRDAEGLKSFMLLLEQEHPLRDLLGRARVGRATVTIGGEAGHPALADCALICRAFQATDGSMGTVAVLGPKRMHYDTALANLNLVVDILGRALWAAAGSA